MEGLTEVALEAVGAGQIEEGDKGKTGSQRDALGIVLEEFYGEGDFACCEESGGEIGLACEVVGEEVCGLVSVIKGIRILLKSKVVKGELIQQLRLQPWVLRKPFAVENEFERFILLALTEKLIGSVHSLAEQFELGLSDGLIGRGGCVSLYGKETRSDEWAGVGIRCRHFFELLEAFARSRGSRGGWLSDRGRGGQLIQRGVDRWQFLGIGWAGLKICREGGGFGCQCEP